MTRKKSIKKHTKNRYRKKPNNFHYNNGQNAWKSKIKKGHNTDKSLLNTIRGAGNADSAWSKDNLETFNKIKKNKKRKKKRANAAITLTMQKKRNTSIQRTKELAEQGRSNNYLDDSEEKKNKKSKKRANKTILEQ